MSDPPARRSAREKYNFTPARRQAFEAASLKRTFQMTPAKQEALRKATEANRQNFRMTPARRRAMRASARRMQKGSVEKFQMTEKRQRANLANIRKAQAAERTPESRLRSRFNHLKHGLQVRTLEETMHLLGEDPKEFQAHKSRFRRVFAPADPTEEKVVDLIAAATWRRLRLFLAQARWEADRLRRFFSAAAPVQSFDADQTRMRGILLLTLLTDRDRFHRHDQSLVGVVEREIRILLRLRAGGDPDFRLYSRESEKEWEQFRRLERELQEGRERIEAEERELRFWERVYRGGPEVEAALARARKNRGGPA